MKLRKKKTSKEESSTDIFTLVFRTLHPDVSFGTVFLLEPDERIRSCLIASFDLHNILYKGFSISKEILEALEPLKSLIRLEDNFKVGYVIILDITSPQINGYDLCKMIKSNPDLNYLPVILIASELSELEKHIGEAKADGYILKPFYFKDLLNTIAKYLYRDDSYYHPILGMEG